MSQVAAKKTSAVSNGCSLTAPLRVIQGGQTPASSVPLHPPKHATHPSHHHRPGRPGKTSTHHLPQMTRLQKPLCSNIHSLFSSRQIPASKSLGPRKSRGEGVNEELGMPAWHPVSNSLAQFPKVKGTCFLVWLISRKRLTKTKEDLLEFCGSGSQCKDIHFLRQSSPRDGSLVQLQTFGHCGAAVEEISVPFGAGLPPSRTSALLLALAADHICEPDVWILGRSKSTTNRTSPSCPTIPAIHIQASVAAEFTALPWLACHRSLSLWQNHL